MTDRLQSNAVSIWQAGVNAVAASHLVSSSIDVTIEVTADRHELLLSIDDYQYDLLGIERLLVVGGGKAAAAMAEGLEQRLEELARQYHGLNQLRIEGLLNIPEGTRLPLKHLRLIEARPAGVNEPTEKGISGSQQMLLAVQQADNKVGCLVLLSGGGSALLPLPIEGIGLSEKLAVTKLLSAAGATINQLNTVRKHLSAIKGGKLAAASNARWLHTLVISDVLGDPLDLIASGPTVPDTSSPADALEILHQFDVDRSLPSNIYQVLEKQIAQLSSKPTVATKNSDATFQPDWMSKAKVTVIGNNAVAVDAAGIEAEKRGYNHAMMSARSSEGLAEEVGHSLAQMAVSMIRDSTNSTNCLITGGEPVVRLAPAEIRGKGGRNQQLVLAALVAWLTELPEIQNALKRRVTLLSGGTDGEDGPTDAAGALVNEHVWSKMEALQLNPTDYLRRNDAYSFFERTGGLLKTGPTGTNVCDIRVLTID